MPDESIIAAERAVQLARVKAASPHWQEPKPMPKRGATREPTAAERALDANIGGLVSTVLARAGVDVAKVDVSPEALGVCAECGAPYTVRPGEKRASATCDYSRPPHLVQIQRVDLATKRASTVATEVVDRSRETYKDRLAEGRGLKLLRTEE
jgi:hypothetical protein